MRLLNRIAVCVICVLLCVPTTIVCSQEGVVRPPVPAQQPTQLRPYELVHANGSTESGHFTSAFSYYLAPGWAKPRRIRATKEVGGAASALLSLRSGQSQTPEMMVSGSLAGMGQSNQLQPEGSLLFHVLVLAKTDADPHAPLIIGQIQQTHSGSMMGGSSSGDMGGYGVGSDMGGYGGGFDMGGTGMLQVVIVPLEECKILKKGKLSSEMQFSATQLKNLADMVRLDCWIEDELQVLRTAGGDAEKLKSSERVLKELLNEEYELQLEKQKEDFERLSEKLKSLQAELARRTSAQERVVEVQLGQLILEAQGLIGERP